MIDIKKNVWYFGLEPIKARYTEQLSTRWIPSAFAEYSDQINFISLQGQQYDKTEQIRVGAVLDAVGRGIYAMAQCQEFLIQLSNGNVKNDDVLYFQDFWHPGIESIFYALDLYKIKVKIYSMLHAQSVDEYDFTYQMRNWMKPIEIGFSKRMDGIFVGSTIHKDQLRIYGFDCPIHVVSLPFGKQDTLDQVPILPKKKNQVIFASRLDKEKNPYFLIDVISQFLEENKNWEWVMTTSGNEFRSNIPNVVGMFNEFASIEPRFKMLKNISKQEYYKTIAESKIMFNCSLQDYVSWTSIEAHTFKTKFVCPNFRSFPDFCNINKMYQPFDVSSAISCLTCAVYGDEFSSISKDLSEISDLGRRLEAFIMVNGIDHEVNIWHEYEYCKNMVNK